MLESHIYWYNEQIEYPSCYSFNLPSKKMCSEKKSVLMLIILQKCLDITNSLVSIEGEIVTYVSHFKYNEPPKL